MTQRAVIKGLGKSLPDFVLTNFDIEKKIDTTDEWIYSRTGIKSRHLLKDTETGAQLALNASLEAIKNANISKNSIDLIICATSIPDNIYPNQSSTLQKSLGLDDCIPCFDISAACTGAIFGLNTAKAFIESGIYKTILLVGMDVSSKVLNWNDRNTCILFGDGAGAVILTAEENSERGLISINMNTDSTLSQHLTLPFVGENEKDINKKQILSMNGKDIYKFALNVVPESILLSLEMANMHITDIDYFVLHQANYRIIKAIQEELNISMDKFYLNIENCANTSAASVLIALAEGINTKRISKNSNICLAGFGAGLSWGSVILKM